MSQTFTALELECSRLRSEIARLTEQALTEVQLKRVIGSLSHDDGCVFTSTICTCQLSPILEKLRGHLASTNQDTEK